MVENNFYDVYFLDKEEVMITEHESCPLTEKDFDSFVKVSEQGIENTISLVA